MSKWLYERKEHLQLQCLSFSLSLSRPPAYLCSNHLFSQIINQQFNLVSDAFTLSLLRAHKRGNQGKSLLPLGLSAALSLLLSPLIIGRENIFKSETLSFFFLLPDGMTKLIFLSVSLTAFKRTLSYHSSRPPYPDPSIPSQLLSRRVRKEQLANTFCHFTDSVTRSSLFYFIVISSIIPSLSFIAKWR